MHKKSISLLTCHPHLQWQASVRRLRTWSLAGVVLVGFSFLTAGTLQANTEDDVLSGLAAGSNLSLASSYSTTAPSTGGVPTTTSDVVFTAAGTYANSYLFGSSLSIGSLNDLSATAITLQNNVGTLTLNGGNSVSGTAADLLYVASGGNLTIANSNGFNLALGASGNFNVAGTAAIAAPITGAFALTKTGTGTLTLTNLGNTFSGGTTVNAGILALGGGAGAGAVRGAVTVNAGATLNLTGNNALGYTAGTQVTVLNINGGTVNTTGAFADEGFLTSFNLTGGTLAYTGTSNANAYQIAAGDATAPNITSNASANLSLISGYLNIRSGNLAINVAKGTTASGVDLQISGQINQAAAGLGVTKNGAGNLLLSFFEGYTGGTTVNGGTLTLGAGSGNGTVLGVVNLASGTTLNLSAVDALGYTSASTVVTTINANGATITNSSGGNEGFLTSLNLTGATVTSTAPTTGANAGKVGSFVFNTTATAPLTITSNASATTSTISAPLFLQNAGSLGLSVAKGTVANNAPDLTISGAITGTGGITKTGAGILNLSGASTFTGNIAVNAGTLNIGAVGTDDVTVSAVGNASGGKTITVASGATLSASLNNIFGRGANPALLPTITLNGGTLFSTRYTAIGALNLNGGTVTTTDITDGPATTGTYQTFQLRGNVTVGGTAPSTINASNVSATTGGIHLDTNTTFTVGSTGSAIDLTVNTPLRNRSGDFGGPTSTGGLTKAGAGMMLLTAANTYTGPTAVTAGRLFVSGSTAAGSAVTVTGAGTVLGGTGNVAGTVNVGNGAILSAGNSALGNVGTLSTGALTLQTGSTFDALLASNASFSTLNAAGSTTLTGAAFSISLANGATFTSGTTLELIVSPVAGQFSNLVYTTGGYSFTADYGANPGFFSVNITAVPEPSTWICGVVLIGCVAVNQRRKIRGWWDSMSA